MTTTQVFDSYAEEALFWVVFLAGMLADSWITRRVTRGSKSAKTKMADRRSDVVVNVANASSFLISVALGYLRLAVLPHWLFYPGLAVFLLGILLAIWATLTLGRFYAPVVQVQSNQTVVDRGPYRRIRHPVYAGAIVAFLGIALAMQSWVAVLAALVINGLGYGYRIRVEERFLTAQLGEAYVAYCARTKRLIPFVL